MAMAYGRLLRARSRAVLAGQVVGWSDMELWNGAIAK